MRIAIFISLLLVAVSADSLKVKENKIHSKKAATSDKIDIKSKKYLEIIKGYQYLKDTLKVKVIYRELPMAGCGIFSVASIWLGVNKKNDTIAFVSLCDQDSSIKINDVVYALPCDSIPFTVDFIGNHWDQSELDNLANYSRQYSTFYCNIAKNISK
jgi:hypothetical protein